MADLRELLDDPEESIWTLLDGMRKRTFTALPVLVAQDTQDGHTVNLTSALKGLVQDQFGHVTAPDYPTFADAPIHFAGGGGVTTTHPVTHSNGDEGLAIFASRNMDGWWDQGGSQTPIDSRIHALADALYIPGIRSNPRKLQQHDNTQWMARSDDKKNVLAHHPQNGTHIKNVDPSTAAASENFDPFTQATTFFEHIVHPSNGHALNAIANGITHSFTNTHSGGPLMSAANGAHTVNAHPENGVAIASTVAHTIGAPNCTLDKEGNLSTSQSIGAPSGSFGSLSFGSGGGASGGNISVPGTVTAEELLISGVFTVAALNADFPPASTPVGARAAVNDATSPGFLAALVGGGTTVCPAFNNGIHWVAG